MGCKCGGDYLICLYNKDCQCLEDILLAMVTLTLQLGKNWYEMSENEREEFTDKIL